MGRIEKQRGKKVGEPKSHKASRQATKRDTQKFKYPPTRPVVETDVNFTGFGPP